MVVAASMALTVQIKCAHTDTRLRRFDPIVGMRTSFISHDTRLTNVIIMATLDQSREIEFHGKKNPRPELPLFALCVVTNTIGTVPFHYGLCNKTMQPSCDRPAFTWIINRRNRLMVGVMC